MPETVDQYRSRMVSYIVSYSKGQPDPLKMQSAAAAKIARLLKGVPASKLRKQPAPGKWSVVQIIAHMADTELVVGFRLRMALSQSGAPLQAYDQDKWA